uniref:Transthyretin/hydroxyisourate hydrolase domain-containing protein n=1 Tax=Panagrellus redivivus TaxID=6233 RepID=A0A7E4W9B7_PANRE
MKAFFLIFLLATTAVTPVHAGFWGDVWDTVTDAAVAVAKVVHDGYHFLSVHLDKFLGGTADTSMRIKGRLLCKGKPYTEGRVDIYEEDLFEDDDWGTVTTNENGYWHAETDDKLDFLWNENEPYIVVYHRCGVTGAGDCFNSFSKPVPQDAMHRTKAEADAAEVYDMGKMELSLMRPISQNVCK